ncbi:uncharacterized protein [Pocillopora verrucosa]|uniref:uncharacterized protein isoform X2 n=1 Tax=Pocillopora verrucosa TaxID=203993 RepID=UPI00333EFC59
MESSTSDVSDEARARELEARKKRYEVFEDSAFRTLELVRGCQYFSATTPTVWIQGDNWPSFSEIVTRYPLCGASKLHVFVDCFKGKSYLTYGLISPQNRKLQVLGVQNGEHLRLTGKLWGWSSQQKKFFKKTFDSKTSFAASSQLTHFYNRDIRNGSVLSIYRDLKSNRIHFDINGEEGWVNFSQNEPDFWYGYIRLSSTGSGSKIQVTLVPEKDQALFRVVPDSCQGSAEISWLSHHYVMHTSHPRGICLLINNVPKLEVVEEKLKNLFKFLSFDVRFRGTSSTVNDECSIFASGSSAEKDAVWLPYIPTSEEDSCPEEADFLVVSVTSTYPADQPNRQPESLFIQILDQVIRCSCQMYHLLDMLTMVNKQMMDKRNDLPNIRIPYRTHTMRERVCLGSTPPSALITSAVAQQASYEMNKNPRGLCVIVNNVDFQNKDLNRPGADKDERSLQLLFKTLLFEVIIRRDLTKHELEKVAQDFGEANHEAYNAFVFIVMSHGGDRDCILGVDGRETTVKNLMSEFRENKCPSLKHKPKVFIIQTCRGYQRDADNSVPSSANDISLQVVTTSSREQKSSQPCGTAFSTDATLPRSVFPPEADFVLAFATAPGYVSYRHPLHGARFIRDLVEVINKYHRRHHFLEILTEVTRLVVERGNSVQVPAPMDTLTKFLYL